MQRELSVFFLICLSLIPGCAEAPDERLAEVNPDERLTEAYTEQELQDKVAEFASQHDAVTNWNESFVDQDFMQENTYSFEVENALVRKDGRPLLILATIDDISKENDTYLLHLSTELLDLVFPQSPMLDLRLVLEGEQDLVEKITTRGARGFIDTYAIIATISSVSRPNFVAKAYPTYGEEAQIVVESPDFFVVRGRCIDLMFYSSW